MEIAHEKGLGLKQCKYCKKEAIYSVNSEYYVCEKHSNGISKEKLVPLYR